MICKHLTKRSYQRKAYIYCRSKKEVITFDDCKKCLKFESREYKGLKKSNKPMKKISNKIAKACDISAEVRKIVFERDNGRCVICNSIYAMPNAHYISRSHGGLGIPQNIVTLCFQCHHDYDNGSQREHHGNLIKRHLQMRYEDWNEEKLIYKKW